MSQDINPRRLVSVKAERASNVSSTDYPGHYPGEDHSWNLEEFSANLKVKVQRLSNRSIEFDVVGVDASIANAFRRIMIAEVPCIAIEQVYVWNNTTVIHDEILAQRIGLVPLNIDPALMEYYDPDAPEASKHNDQNTVVFKIDLTCERRRGAAKDETDPDKLYVNHELLSSHLTWSPVGQQEEIFPLRPAATNLNIVLAKLRPGQTVKMDLHAVKGVGKDHAKFSPVATASYRILPHITIKKPIPPYLAEKFQKCFAPGVINLDPKTKTVSVDPYNVRKDTVSREVLRHPEFEGMVELGRVRDHFLFNVESEGPYPPERIFIESIKVMREKLALIKKSVNLLQNGSEDVEMSGP